MFWTTLKWGATAVLMVVFGLALFRAANPGGEAPEGGRATSAEPTAPQEGNHLPPKKFNF